VSKIFRTGREVPIIKRLSATYALNIDRRLHLELAWRRQSELEGRTEAAAKSLKAGEVVEVENLEMMDKLLESTGPVLLIVFMYSKV